MSTVIYCASCHKCLAMIHKGKVRTDERMHCSECYGRAMGRQGRPAGSSMGERDGLDQLKSIFGIMDE